MLTIFADSFLKATHQDKRWDAPQRWHSEPRRTAPKVTSKRGERHD